MCLLFYCKQAIISLQLVIIEKLGKRLLSDYSKDESIIFFPSKIN